MNKPNSFAIIKIILTIIMIILLLMPWYEVGITFPRFLVGGIYISSKYLISGGIFLIASVIGLISKKSYKEDMLNHVIDVMLIDTAVIILASQSFINTFIPIMIILYDIVTYGFRLELLNKGKIIIESSSNKIRMITLIIGITLTFFYNLPFELLNINISDFLLYFSSVMTIFSIYEYYQKNKKSLLAKED
ncbi:MAG: hypothetical protein RSE56_03860 [Bacilli bacterium]